MPDGIERSVLAAIVEGRLAPGARLSEARLAEAFGVSRTLVREALARLQARHVVAVRPRRGWFVARPDADEAAQVFAARRAVEHGFLATARPFDAEQVARLEAHLGEERDAIAQGDKPRLTYLMGDFHARIVALSGNEPLTEIMRNLTARTILISLCRQSSDDALASHRDHVRIVGAIASGDMAEAARLSVEHLDAVEAGLGRDTAPDPLAALRDTLRLDPAPDGAASPLAPSPL